MRLFTITLLALASLPIHSQAAIALATAIEDGTVLAAQPDTVFDTHTLNVKRERNNGSVSRKSWIKFDLSAFTLAADTGATLNLKIADPIFDPSSPTSHQVHVYALNADFSPEAGQLDSDWTDDLLTFNNAPGNDSSYTQADSNDTTYLGSFTTQSSGPSAQTGALYSFQFSDLASYLNPTNSTMTLILTTSSAGDSNLKFASSENIEIATTLNNDEDPGNDITPVTGPELQFSVVPEPASAALLLGFSSLLLAAIRRQRGR